MKKTKIQLGKKLILGKDSILSLSASNGIAGGATGTCVTNAGQVCGECGFSQTPSCLGCPGITEAGNLTCSPSCNGTISAVPGPGCAGSQTCPGITC
ncbi:class I lanthipeptide [Taibaiella helva]|uniref:class I lanthipeptide n=1 Tax=Taibaiella helva TaxID=2301235 RepID=UPI0018E5828D